MINEINHKDIDEFLTKFIAPAPPITNYWWGNVDEKLVSYLEIIPEPTPKPYQIKENLVSIDSPLCIGDCWVRKGESKGEPLSEDEKQYVYAWTQVPYIKHQNWINYLNMLVSLSGKSAKTINGYQDLYSTNKQTLENEVVQFINDSSLSLLVIKGNAGCGKSVFLRDLARKLANNLLQELNTASQGYGKFTNPIPIFMYLNQFSIDGSQTFIHKIFRQMDGHQELEVDRGNEPEKIFRDQGKQWVVLLDAFDEAIVDPINQAYLRSAICSLAEIANVKIILTVRTDIEPPQLLSKDKNKVIVVSPLERNQVINFLHAQLTASISDEKFSEYLNFLNSEDGLWEHLQFPLFLGVAAGYFDGHYDPASTSDALPFNDESIETRIPTEDQEIENNQDSVEAEPFDPSQFIANNVETTLVDQAEMSLTTEEGSDDKFSEDIEIPLKLGKLLHHVFEQLWEHNKKKNTTGLKCGTQGKTFEDLGILAVYEPGRLSVYETEAEKHLDERLNCVLDLGILLRSDRRTVSFLNFLSKSYFAAYFLDILLEFKPQEIRTYIKDPPSHFWEKCLEIVKDISSNEVSALEKRVKIVKFKELLEERIYRWRNKIGLLFKSLRPNS